MNDASLPDSLPDPTQDNGTPACSDPAPPLRIADAAGRATPVGDEVLIESMRPDVLAKMRFFNEQIGLFQQRAQDIFESYISGRGWSNITHEINLNFASGQISVKAR